MGALGNNPVSIQMWVVDDENSILLEKTNRGNNPGGSQIDQTELETLCVHKPLCPTSENVCNVIVAAGSWNAHSLCSDGCGWDFGKLQQVVN